MPKKTNPQPAPAKSEAKAPIHPGQYIRDSIITPKKLSVLAAAKLVGVGRPALSNFLNGHVAATPDMASRIEVAFGVPAQSLLDMQAAYDAAETKAKGLPANAMPYVVPFLGIKAKEIETWVDRNILARTRLSVLLRTLVNSAGSGIAKVDFPGNDDSERPGWDGYIDSMQPTPWIPDGLSGWEFGTNQDIKGKADGDFAKSVKAVTKSERVKTTFVFVTPRNWPGKREWIQSNRAKGQWKDVRAYDSSDLEQWIEQSITAQAWFANETLRPSKGVRSLDKCWSEWATVANPPLAGSLFAPAVESATRMMVSRLSQQPNEPTVIAADSAEEALAFLAQLFGLADNNELAKHRDRVLVFDEPGVLPDLAQGAMEFIAITANRNVERELGPLARSIHSIVAYPRNAANADPHIVLQPLNNEAFRVSLEEMGYRGDDIAKYSNESGRSLTVLRRRLASVPAVRMPEWAANPETASRLIPFLFVGAWNSTNAEDQTALMLLANVDSYEKLEKEAQQLASLNDAPLWSVGTHRGVVSKMDLLFAIARSMTSHDLQRYFVLAKIVLDEDDPKLDLPESERWAATFHGKSREFSASLREGISETLVLLAVHGNHLFRDRQGFDCESAVTRLVRDLLTPLKARILEANDRDLAAYAEAAPNEFLSILEEDLRADSPESYALMKPVGNSIFGGGSARCGLLWALEGLAWSSETLPRTALILAQLAGIEISDNLANKPISSLESIFRVWMPQTAADHSTRLSVMKLIQDKFPMTAWKLCIDQLNSGQQIGNYNHKPKWRNDAHGFGEPFKTLDPVFAFVRELVDMLLTWKGGYTREMLVDLIQHIHELMDEHQTMVWDLVTIWANAGASDIDKAFVREKIRVTVMSRRGLKRSNSKESKQLSIAGKAIYQSLAPTDLLCRHAWLFRESWVEESADELYDEEVDFQKREERIVKLRKEALCEIYEARGLEGIFELAEMGKTAYQIGWLMTERLSFNKNITSFMLAALPITSHSQYWAKRNLLSGLLHALAEDKERVSILNEIGSHISQDDFVQILLLAPFGHSTWKLVDELDKQHRDMYWNDVAPNRIYDNANETREAVERLLSAQRPRTAFVCVQYKIEALGPELIFRLMSEMAKEGKDKPDQYHLDDYHIEQAFMLIDKSPLLTLEQKAGLEFAYIEILSKPWSKHEAYGIPNLEKYVEMHPELFVQGIVWLYKRKVEGEDPPEWRVDSEHSQQFAKRAYKLIEGLDRIPGHDDLGVIQKDKLAAWVKVVRDACTELDRMEIGDLCIGKLLSRSPLGEDGAWPCEPVRQVMEDVHSKNMMEGAHTGLYNSRGVVSRTEGGDQERQLAEKYRAWANALHYSHPFVASELLMGMVKTYEHEANREDTEAVIRRRLH